MENTDVVDVAIDPATGLPALPEEVMFWEVVREDYFLTVKLCRKTTKVRQTGWTLLLPIRSEVVEIVGSKELRDYEEIWEGKLGRVHELKINGYRDVGLASRYYLGFERVWEPTEDNILRAAKIVYRDYESMVESQKIKRKAEEHLNSLVGIYPPKTLTVGGE